MQMSRSGGNHGSGCWETMAPLHKYEGSSVRTFPHVHSEIKAENMMQEAKKNH